MATDPRETAYLCVRSAKILLKHNILSEGVDIYLQAAQCITELQTKITQLEQENSELKARK